MALYDPVVWRTARLVHEHLQRRRRVQSDLYLPHASWANAQQLVRQIDASRQRGWDRATRVLRQRLIWQLERLEGELDRVTEVVNHQSQYRPIPSVPELADEIRALAGEFEDVEYKPRAGSIRATTAPIVLRSIDLGRFQIELNVKALSTSQYYRIIALEPHAAADNPSVTHPHVQNEHLCEGEGHAAIQEALAEGRLFDFFLIVSQLLSNYGEGSAYVELRDWHGLPCGHCGSNTSDEGSYCQRCDDRLCDDCTSWCDRCGSCYCDHCISSCNGCDESFCQGCLDACSDCQKSHCSHCLEEGRCHACRDESVQSPEPPGSEDHPLGLAAGTAGVA